MEVDSTLASLDSATPVTEGSFGPAGARSYHRWHRPPAGSAAVARLLILHGYGDHGGRFSHFGRWMADRGVSVDTFDFRGHGRSDGRRGYVRRWDEYLDDVRLALATCRPAWAAEGLADKPLFVLGHSHGGLVLATAASRGVLAAGEVAGAVMTAPWFAPAEPIAKRWKLFAAVAGVLAPAVRVKTGLSPDMMSADPAMIADSRADVLLLRSATPRWYVGATRTQRRAVIDAPAFRLPLICLFGDRDRVASLAAAKAFVSAAGSADKSMVVVSDARHELLREAGREQTFATILGWLSDRAAASSAQPS